MKLPETSVRRPVTTLMIYLGVIMVGLFTLMRTPLDLFPEIDIPAITVITIYEGAGPEEIEEKITRQLERRLATVQGLKDIISISREGQSEIRMMFDWGSELDARANDIRDSIDMVQQFLPSEAERPRLFKFDLSQMPILIYGVHADESYEYLETILDDLVAAHLEGVPGVGAIDVFVPLQREINVDIELSKMLSRGLTFDDVAGAITLANVQAAAGSLKMGDIDYLPRVLGEFDSIEPMNDIVVKADESGVVRLRDIATVTDGFKDLDLHVTINEKRGAMLAVRKQPDANTVQVVRDIETRLRDLRQDLPPDVDIIGIMDSSEDIVLMVRDLFFTLLVGGLMAILTVFVFLRQIRSTFIIALTIPFSLIASAVFMYFLDYSINMITLFALLVSIGLVVDNAIVVLENITRHLEEGESRWEGAVYGAAEVGMAITASSLTTLCVFFPLLFVRGVARVIFVPFAAVASVIILAALFTALTMTPMLASRLLPDRLHGVLKPENRIFKLTERFFESMADGYSRLLGWCLRRRRLVISSVLALLLLSGVLIPFIGWEFMPREDTAMIQGELKLPVGTRIERTREALAAVQQIMNDEIGEHEKLVTYQRVGAAAGPGTRRTGGHIGHFGARLVRQDRRDRYITDIADGLRNRIEEITALYSIEEYRLDTSDMVSGLATGGQQPLTINILGDDLSAAEEYAARIRDRIAMLPGAVDVRMSMEEGTPEIQVKPDRAKLGAMGVQMGSVADTVRAGIHGRTASWFRHRGDEFEIFVRLREEDRARAEDVGMLPVRLPSGELAPVENLAEIEFGVGPLQIERHNQRRVVRVEGNVRDRSLGELIGDVREVLQEVEPPAGLTVDIAGEFEDIQEAFLWMGIALVIGAILVYMIMASQFESLSDPFVVMFAVPMGFIGVLWGLFLRGFTVNIIVFLGMLLLIGIVVNNAIVLVDYINILRARGRDMESAIREGGKARLRPVLMTALTTSAALVPMAFHRGQGWEVWNPLGTTILGGLLVSSLVTLVIVPTMYSLIKSDRVRR